jgi:hypothetical protein
MERVSCHNHVRLFTGHSLQQNQLVSYANSWNAILKKEASKQGIDASSELKIWSPPQIDCDVDPIPYVQCLFFEQVDDRTVVDIFQVIVHQRKGFIYTFSHESLPNRYKQQLIEMSRQLHEDEQPIIEFHSIVRSGLYRSIQLRTAAGRILSSVG